MKRLKKVRSDDVINVDSTKRSASFLTIHLRQGLEGYAEIVSIRL
jgi:hypothetical protein